MNIKVVSDSIILWTNDDNSDAFVQLCLITSALSYFLYRYGLPLRGAIDLGEVVEVPLAIKIQNKHIDTNILLGKGITRSYQLESLQQWSGCIISNDAINHYETIATTSAANIKLKNLLETNTILKYHVPLKSGLIQEYHVLDWPFYFDNMPSDSDVRATFSAHSKSISTWEVENKIKNTIEFIKYSISKRTQNGS